MLFKHQYYFTDFIGFNEAIATNILSNRLKKMEEVGLVIRYKNPQNKRQWIYLLTKEALALSATVVEMMG